MQITVVSLRFAPDVAESVGFLIPAGWCIAMHYHLIDPNCIRDNYGICRDLPASTGGKAAYLTLSDYYHLLPIDIQR
jgi:hypothetical protein